MTPEEREYKDLELRMQLLHHCHNMLLVGVAIIVGVCGLIAFLLTDGVEISSQLLSANYIVEQAASTHGQDEKLTTNTGSVVSKDSQDGQPTTQEKFKTSDQNIVDKKAWDVMLVASACILFLLGSCSLAYLHEHKQFTKLILSSDYINKDDFANMSDNIAAKSMYFCVSMLTLVPGAGVLVYLSESTLEAVFWITLTIAYIIIVVKLYFFGEARQKTPSIQKEDDRNTPKYYAVGVNDHEHGRTQNYTISVSRIDDDGTRDD